MGKKYNEEHSTLCRGGCGREFPVDPHEFFHICEDCSARLEKEIERAKSDETSEADDEAA